MELDVAVSGNQPSEGLVAQKLYSFSSAPATPESLIRHTGSPLIAALNGKILYISNLDSRPMCWNSFETVEKKLDLQHGRFDSDNFPDVVPSFMIDSQDVVWQSACWVPRPVNNGIVLLASDSRSILWRFSVSLETGVADRAQVNLETSGLITLSCTQTANGAIFVALGRCGVLQLVKLDQNSTSVIHTTPSTDVDGTPTWFASMSWYETTLAVGTSNGGARLYRLNADTGSLEQLSVLATPQTLATANCLRWGANGKYLAIAFGAQVLVWNFSTTDLNAHSPVVLIEPIRMPVTAIRWLNNDSALICACNDGTLIEWRMGSLNTSDLIGTVIDCGRGPFYGLETSPYDFFLFIVSVTMVKTITMYTARHPTSELNLRSAMSLDSKGPLEYSQISPLVDRLNAGVGRFDFAYLPSTLTEQITSALLEHVSFTLPHPQPQVVIGRLRLLMHIHTSKDLRAQYENTLLQFYVYQALQQALLLSPSVVLSEFEKLSLTLFMEFVRAWPETVVLQELAKSCSTKWALSATEERCPYCQTNVTTVPGQLSTTCPKGHKLDRCMRSLVVVSKPGNPACGVCGYTVDLLSYRMTPFLNVLSDIAPRCLFCGVQPSARMY